AELVGVHALEELPEPFEFLVGVPSPALAVLLVEQDRGFAEHVVGDEELERFREFLERVNPDEFR
ncbi:MAG: hypothetical protein ACKOKE_05695, partial [Actinomycetota bacterium]